MADLPIFLTHIKTVISQQTWFTECGLTPAQIYKQFLPQIKDPIYPCITLGYESDPSELFADIENGSLYLDIYSKDFNLPWTISNYLKKPPDKGGFHNYHYADDTLIVFQMLYLGGAGVKRATPLSTVPTFDTSLNAWVSQLEFGVRLG